VLVEEEAMRTPIEIGEDYRRKFLPKCWEETDHLLRRRSLVRPVVWLVAWGFTWMLLGFVLGALLVVS